MNKLITSALAGSFLMAGSIHAVDLSLSLPEAGYYSATGTTNTTQTITTATTITTSTSFGGATFDIEYIIGSLATGANSFVRSTGSMLGVGSDTDILQHYTTLEGNDAEGISFTGLTVTNFVENDSGLTVDDITDLTFSEVTFTAVANAQDGVYISFTDFSDRSLNQNLNSAATGGTPFTSVLSHYRNYTSPETDLYLTTDNTSSSNRWAITGIDISYAVPESGSFALFAGFLGLSSVMLRRRKA